MTAAKPKFFIASTRTLHIGYRKLTPFEERNPHMFAFSHAAFDTWEEANHWLLKNRKDSVDQAKRLLTSAEKQLVKAIRMKKPENR